MAYTTINKSTDYFNTKLYTGNNSVRTETGVGFQPDWVWIKDRTQSHNHNLLDAVRGAPKILMSDSTSVEITDSTDGLTAFTSDGFSLGANTTGTQSQELNKNGNNYVAWNWKANGAGSANTDGSISSTVSVNTTAGFSIVSYTGNGSTATVGHGLGSNVDMVILKDRSRAGENWVVYHKDLGKDKVIYMNLTNAVDNATDFWGTSTPNSSVFGVKTGNTSNNWSGDNFIAYCFAEKTGYSKFGSYTGNGSTDGTFVYTGFKPAFLMIKRTDNTSNWLLYDNRREGYNQTNDYLNPDNSNAEGGGDNYLDLLSNGFKTRVASQSINVSGASYIYMCFASAPLVGTNNVPCTAR